MKLTKSRFSNVNGGYSNPGYGYGYGVGVQVFFTKNVFFQGDFMAVKAADTNFNGWAVNGGTTGVTTLNVGYKF